MNKTIILLAAGIVSLLPLSALAADAPASDNAAKPATGELHGFDKYWSMIDPDGKGYVTKDEWMARAAAHFKEIDTNGDGKITKEEMHEYDRKMYQHRMEMRDQYRKEHQDKQ